jgi:hypothetical protein
MESLHSRELYTYPQIELYEKLYKTASYWHGTGRYQYDANGNVIDVLSSILEHGGLKPHTDYYNWLDQGKDTISFGRSRSYSIKYADMHSDNIDRLPSRNLSNEDFVEQHIVPVNKRIWEETQRKIGKKLTNIAFTNLVGSPSWTKKIRQDGGRVRDAFLLGSDIQGNYPILMGIKQLENLEEIPGYLSQYEVRTAQSVPLNTVTHMETPAEKIEETKRLLDKGNYDLPVFPIELGEMLEKRWCSLISADS